MASMVKNNMTALQTLNTLNKNNNLLAKSLQKVSSGMKINSAADSASAYSISEGMRVQLRALDQCNSNTKTGTSMLSVAEGAIDNQIQLIKRMKEIALDAANDTNTDADRAIMQKEVNARLMELNNISYSTEYNGRQLLNGIVPGEQTTSFNAGSGISPNTTPVITEGTNETSHPPYSLPSFCPSNNYITKTSDPTYIVYDPNNIIRWDPDNPGKTYNQGDTVYDSSGNPYTVIPDPSTGVLSVEISIGVYEAIGTFIPHIGVFQSVPMSNTVFGQSYSTNSTMPANNYTVGRLPDGKKVLMTSQPAVDTSNFYDLNLDTPNINANLPTSLDKQGFSVLCGACDQFVCVQFDAAMPAYTGTHDTDKATGAECYIVGIAGLNTVNDIYDALQKVIPKQLTSYHNVNLNFYQDNQGNKHCYITKDESTFKLDIYDGVVGAVETTGGKLPWQNLVIQGDTVSSQFTRIQLPNTTLAALFPDKDSTWDTAPKASDYPNPWPKGYEENRTWPPEWGEDYIATASLQAKRQRLWEEEVWPYPVKGAISTGSCVSTREKALQFISSLDQALKYLTHAATTVGVQDTRLNYMNDNIVTSHENTTAAESVIRDADMAKEMTNYSKYNVLTQSAQSMLAQSNQNLGNSLDLLK